ncbi:MAG: 50S ribosomal protein L35 [Candidatus Elulimicrobiales bacterium]|nr:50S ribosomal protein L35 [Candidatus Elulimicrobiales bacterium]
MKTNKSLAKRLKVTKTGKVLGRKPGFNHFNSRQSRTKQLAGRKMSEFQMTNKVKRRFLPGLGK